jgi:peptidoglycan/xylan/chitin deacetylase (PgdA/CDA1 family)
MRAQHTWTLLHSPIPTPAVQTSPTPQAPSPLPAPQAGVGPIAMGPAPAPARRMSDIPGSGVTPGEKVVALTFDDGPDPTYTPQVLAVLARFQVTATFFMIGWEAAADPNLVQEVDAAGDGVANHTWSHLDLTRQGGANLGKQVDQTDNLLASLTRRRITCLRPPQGHENPSLLRALGGRGLTTVLWSDDTNDWRRPGTARIVRTAMTELAPGAIILLHDGGGNRSETVQALPMIIQGIRAAGYRFAPICR